MAYPGRTTVQAVQNLLIDFDTSSVVTTNFPQWIDAANEVTTQICATPNDPTYTAHTLYLIETYLSAHFYCLYDPRASAEGVSSVRANYEGKTGMLLKWSRYGQMTLVLDTGGYLSNMDYLMSIGKFRRKLGVLWLGEPCPPKPDVGYQIFPSPALDQSS